MNENTDAEELQRSLLLMRVIEKQPRLFAKWNEIKERFDPPGAYDGRPNDPPFYIADALARINEAFDNDDRQPARI